MPHTPSYSQQPSHRQQDVQPKSIIEDNRSDVDIIDETRTINGKSYIGSVSLRFIGRQLVSRDRGRRTVCVHVKVSQGHIL